MVFFRVIILAILIGTTLFIQAENNYPQKFETLSIKDGLSHNNVYCAIQDERGLLWFGTANGLNRYDGYSFQTFKFDPNNSNSLSSNYVKCLIQDSIGNIWAGTDKGLTRYNTTTGIFTAFLNIPNDSSSISNNDIRALYEDMNGNIWIGTAGGGVNLIANSDKGKDNIEFERYEFDSNKKNYVYAIYEDNKSNIWLGTESNLILFKKVSGTRDYKTINFQLLNSDKNSIRNIMEGDGNSLIISTYEKGVFELDLMEKKLAFYPPEECLAIKRIVNESSKLTNTSFIDSKGNLWIGTRGSGIAYVYGFQNNESGFFNLEHNPLLEHSLSGNFINGFLEDQSGIIWILMNGEGICKYIPNRKPFQKVGYRGYYSEQLRNISSVVEDNKGNLIIGTRHRGLLKYEPDDISGKKRTKGNLIELNWSVDKDIKKIIKVADHYWIATSNKGIKVFNQKGKLVQHFYNKEDSNSLSHNYVFDLFQDSRGLIWIGTWGGTYGGGLDMYDPVADKFIRFFNKKGDAKSLSQNIVLSIEEDAYGQIWVGTKNAGLNLLQKNNGKYFFKRFKNIPGDSLSLDDDHVTDIYKAKDNTLWIATESGLNKFNYSTWNFERVYLNDELFNQKIGSILEDKNKKIWLTTSAGLIRYNPFTKDALAFNSKDGLHAGYKDGIILKGSKENVFFGQKGIVIFNSNEIRINPVAPSIVLTDIEIFGLDKNNSKNSRLRLTIPGRDEIILPHNENNFALQFAALNYIKPEKNKYAYRLDGYDEKGHWNYRTSGNRIVNYSNLREGNYTFHVKASNNDGVWNEEGKTLEIKILPPYYRSILAYIFYLVFIAGLVYAAIRLIVKREEERNRLKIERLEHKKNQEINQAKLRFFTNISHEFRTPLTLILGPVERLLKSSSVLPEDKKKDIYIGMHKNASRLLRLINELMDFRKLEAGALKLNIQNREMVSFVRNIYSCFEEIAEEREIKFDLVVPSEEIDASFDPEKLEKVLYNLLSNSFKYTPDRGRISMLLKKESYDQVIIQVEDSGKGIAAKDRDKIFNRFYHIETSDDSKQKNQGTGIGLALTKNLVEMHGGRIDFSSIPDQKTCFSVTLPLNKLDTLADEKNKNIPNILSSAAGKFPEHDVNANNTSLSIQKEVKRGKNYQLMIVDDNPEIRTFIKNEFLNDYFIVEAENGRNAIEKVHENNPDLIISDVMMPEMDGFEFCKLLKTDLKTSHIPVILLTAKSTEDSLIEGLETGADAYVAKPFNISVLEVRIRKLIEIRQNLRNLYSSSLKPEPKSLVTNTLDEEFLANAIAVVEENLDDSTLNVEMFCQKMGMGKTSLHDKMKALTGKSTGEFIRSIRLKHAARLLNEGRLNVSEVSYTVGFNTVWYFSKCFKKEFNVSPSNYKGGDILSVASENKTLK